MLTPSLVIKFLRAVDRVFFICTIGTNVSIVPVRVRSAPVDSGKFRADTGDDGVVAATSTAAAAAGAPISLLSALRRLLLLLLLLLPYRCVLCIFCDRVLQVCIVPPTNQPVQHGSISIRNNVVDTRKGMHAVRTIVVIVIVIVMVKSERCMFLASYTVIFHNSMCTVEE